MRVKLIPTAALGLLVGAAACSKPSGTERTTADTSRNIRLAEEPSVQESTVSDLEAQRTPPQTVLPRARRNPSRTPAAAPVPAPVHNHAELMAEVEPRANLRVVTQTELPAPLPEVSLPAPRGPAPGEATQGEGPSGDRGPMILIRGGMGGVHDDCKIHGTGLGGLGGGGIAINRVTPPLQRGLNSGSHSLGGRLGGVRIR